ncbi:hypothetical protein JMUB6875_03020 [Nocardia sp. JMUB6875]
MPPITDSVANAVEDRQWRYREEIEFRVLYAHFMEDSQCMLGRLFFMEPTD